MENITFDQMPKALVQLSEKVGLIEQMLNQFFQGTKKPENEFLNVEETAKYLGLATATIYDMAHKKSIPYCKKGKKLYFVQSELNQWILSSRRKTNEEINQEALLTLSKKKRG